MMVVTAILSMGTVGDVERNACYINRIGSVRTV